MSEQLASTKERQFTRRQQRFIEEYPIDLNATQACIRAGYSAKTADVAGPRLLGKVRIKAAIQERLEERAQEGEIRQAWILRKLVENHANATEDRQHGAANKALELLGRHIGMFGNRLEVDTSDRLSALLEAIQDRPRPGPVIEHAPQSKLPKPTIDSD